jgi:hypothetical protein
MLQHFWVNNSLKIKVHKSRLYCHLCILLQFCKGMFRGKNSIPKNTGIDITNTSIIPTVAWPGIGFSIPNLQTATQSISANLKLADE